MLLSEGKMIQCRLQATFCYCSRTVIGGQVRHTAKEESTGSDKTASGPGGKEGSRLHPDAEPSSVLEL